MPIPARITPKEASMKTYRCATCKNILGENKPAPLVFRAADPSATPPKCVIPDEAFPGTGWKVTLICNSAKCFKEFLEKMLLSEFNHNVFEKNAVAPGMWFGPNGCIHFLKNIHTTSKEAFGWLEYAFGIWGKANSKFKVIHDKMFAEFATEYEEAEAKPATISLVGGYGYIFDGCFHFCDPFCALATFFPNEYLSKYRWIAELLSYSGLPHLHKELYRETNQ